MQNMIFSLTLLLFKCWFERWDSSVFRHLRIFLIYFRRSSFDWKRRISVLQSCEARSRAPHMFPICPLSFLFKKIWLLYTFVCTLWILHCTIQVKILSEGVVSFINCWKLSNTRKALHTTVRLHTGARAHSKKNDCSKTSDTRKPHLEFNIDNGSFRSDPLYPIPNGICL